MSATPTTTKATTTSSPQKFEADLTCPVILEPVYKQQNARANDFDIYENTGF